MCRETLSEEVRQRRERAVAFFREAWSLALLKAGTAEEEANKVLVRVAELSGLSEAETRKFAETLGERLALQRGEFEQSLEQHIHSAVGHMKLPGREQFEAMQARLERIEARISSLHASKPRGNP